jgi:hypothetical protein
MTKADRRVTNSAALLTGNARLLWWVGMLLAWLLWPGVAVQAHVGAPYPVLLEQAVGPYVVSALADPDVGAGTFIVQVLSAEGTAPPADTVVTLWVTPQDGHADEAGHQAQRQMTKDGERFIAKVPFDARGMWDVRLVVEGAAGRGEITFPVEVTPPYPGAVTTIVCLIPFIILGGLWAAGALRSRGSPRPTPPE